MPDKTLLVLNHGLLSPTDPSVHATAVLYGRNPDGKFAKLSTTEWQTERGGFGFLVGDVNRDGVPELVHVGERVAVHRLSSSGGYELLADEDVASLVPGFDGPWFSPAIVDPNGDGNGLLAVFYVAPGSALDLALLTLRVDNQSVELFQNTGPLGLFPSYYPQGFQHSGQVVANMRGDQSEQIVLAIPARDPGFTQPMVLFSPDGSGQYHLTWNGNIPIANMGRGTEASTDPDVECTWLAVDIDGDRKAKIAQLFSAPLEGTPTVPVDVCCLRLFGWDGAGGLKEISSVVLESVGDGFARWLAADLDGDGRDEIIQLNEVSSTPQMSLTVYKYGQQGTSPPSPPRYYKYQVASTICPPARSVLRAWTTSGSGEGADDQLVILWVNGGTLTASVFGGGLPMRRLEDHPLDDSGLIGVHTNCFSDVTRRRRRH